MLTKFLNYCHVTGKPVYIEHNDFLSGGLTLDQEIHDLLDEGSVDYDGALKMRNRNSIWSVRVYHSKENFVIQYSDDLNDAIKKICVELEVAPKEAECAV